MKSQRLLVCALSLALMHTPHAFSAPVPSTLAQFRTEEQTSINVYEIANPAVVSITTGYSGGSGSIISPEGLVLTNEHVIRGARNGVVNVRTASGNTYRGQVIASDRRNDLALVQLQTQDRLPTLRLADADGIRVGQQVYAIGSPYGLSGTFTTGILSRIAENGDLQTDASLNPGNSGGPLLNSRGELIGVNKAILSPNRVSNTGIGFATSALVAKNFITQARTRTSNPPIANQSLPPAPRLGIVLDSGLTIRQVQRGSLAANIGLRPGDRLLGVNGRRLRSATELQAFLDQRPSSAILTVGRNRRLANVRVNF